MDGHFSNWILRTKGGSGSGNFGHKGRKGKIGGSASEDTAMTSAVAESASEIINRMREGGFTYRPTKGFHEIGQSGYAVALPGHEAVYKAAEFTPRHLIDYWMSVRDLVRKNSALNLGGWYDAENGVYCLDLSEVHPDKAKAIRLGKERKQAAIFDLGSGEEIRLNADEGRLSESAKERLDMVSKKLKAVKAIRTLADMHQTDPEKELAELEALGRALGVSFSEEDRDYFRKQIQPHLNDPKMS